MELHIYDVEIIRLYQPAPVSTSPGLSYYVNTYQID